MSYWDNVEKIYTKQRDKGIREYGQTLEDNWELSDPSEIADEAEEELVDALMYIEHLKKNLCNGEEDDFDEECALSDIVQDAVITALKEVIPVIGKMMKDVLSGVMDA